MNIDAYEHRDNIYWPMLSVSPNFSVIYWKPEKPYHRELTEQDKLNMKFNSSFGMLSKKAKSKIRKAVNYLIYISNFQDVCLVKEKKQIKLKLEMSSSAATVLSLFSLCSKPILIIFRKH